MLDVIHMGRFQKRQFCQEYFCGARYDKPTHQTFVVFNFETAKFAGFVQCVNFLEIDPGR